MRLDFLQLARSWGPGSTIEVTLKDLCAPSYERWNSASSMIALVPYSQLISLAPQSSVSMSAHRLGDNVSRASKSVSICVSFVAVKSKPANTARVAKYRASEAFGTYRKKSRDE